MKNIEDINKAAIKKIVAGKKIADFSPGDTIKVGVKIIEGKRERSKSKIREVRQKRNLRQVGLKRLLKVRRRWSHQSKESFKGS